MKKSMHSFIALVIVMLLLISLVGPGLTAAAETVSPQNAAQRPAFADTYDPETILVKFRPGTPADTIRSLNAQLHLEEKGIISQIGVRMMKVPRGRTAADMVAVLSRNPNIEFVDYDYTMQTALTPNDPLFSSGQPGLKAIEAEAAWDLSVGSDSVLIAVLDTGINASHEDLAGRIVSGYNFIADNSQTYDDHGHGTMVAGVLGALSDNGRGIAGVTWKNPILPVKVMGADGSGSHSAIAQGIIYAADQGARVINLSLGGNSSSSTLKSAVDYAAGKGAVMVAAAGNSNSSVMYPAAYENVIAVAALDQNEKASYSNYGPEISVTAPGTVASTTASGKYATGSGTSFASPFVAGLAGLLLSESPGLSPQQVQQIMEEQADDLGAPGWDSYHGWGRINLYQSLTSLAEAPPTIQLLGDSVVHVPLGEVYDDAGATASDPSEGDITSRIETVNPVDVDVPGTYTITYNVSNTAGITAEEVTRLVIVEEILLPPVGGGGGGMPATVREQLPPRALQAIDNRRSNNDNTSSRPAPSETAPGRSKPAASSSTTTSGNSNSSSATGNSNVRPTTNSGVSTTPGNSSGSVNAPNAPGRRP